MGKKGKGKKDKEPEKKSIPIAWIIAAVVVVIAALAISGNLPFSGTEKETGKSFNLTGKETRPVMDSAMFTGQTRAAYAAAKKYSKYLNEVYCYCYCDADPFNHKTLLSCFTERHGAG
jgi:flagellar basal body-associated protein FliL